MNLGLLLFCVIVAVVALFIGWLVAFNSAEKPTLGDVLIGTAMSSGFPAFLIIVLAIKLVH